jgi:hypothetical protein
LSSGSLSQESGIQPDTSRVKRFFQGAPFIFRTGEPIKTLRNPAKIPFSVMFKKEEEEPALKRSQRWISLTLIGFLLFGWLLPAAAYADGARIVINGLYLSTTTPDESADQVPRVTDNPVSLSVSIENISDTDISRLYYEITNVSTNSSVVEKNNLASKTGEHEVTFSNVYLTEGLNKIVVKLDGASSVSSAPGWIRFTPTTNLANLSINGAPFDDQKMYPDNPGDSSAVTISGQASNATEVLAYRLGDPSPVVAFLNQGQFFFLADDISKTRTTTNFRLTPGDNPLTIIASNEMKSYQIQKNLIYDNGKPFAFQAEVNSEKLIAIPKIVESADHQVTLTALLKVDLQSDGSLQYNKVDVSIGGNRYTYDLAGGALGSPDPVWSRADRYNVYRLTRDVNMLDSAKVQLVNFKFYNVADASDQPSTSFTFNYVKPNMPYIDHVSQQVGDSELTLSESGIVEFSELPVHLKIYADANTSKVEVKADGATLQTLDSPAAEGDAQVFAFDLDNLPGGRTTLSVIPLDASGNPNADGGKGYDINISTVPYIIVNNMYNGMVLKETSDLACGSEGSCVFGRLINMPGDVNAGGPFAVKVAVNGVSYDLQGIDQIKKTFQHILKDGGGASLLEEGKNTIRFEVYQNGRLVSQSTYEVYLFTRRVPEILSLAPAESQAAPKYIPGSKPDSYVTKEYDVAFNGSVANATSGTVTVRRSKTDNGLPAVETISLSGINNGSFTTNTIPLSSEGDTVFEFVFTNELGITVSKTITVTREPLPYIIISPSLAKNDKNEDQATVNANYVHVELEADNADSVVFGKIPAQTQQVTVNGYIKTHYIADIDGLKPGKNTIKFTVVRGQDKINGSFVVYNTNTSVAGAQYKAGIAPKMKVFDGLVELDFPKGTNLLRNDPGAVRQFITPDAQLLFGIADSSDGRVDKYKHPATWDGQFDNPNPILNDISQGKQLLQTPSNFRPASDLIWIDGGMIERDNSYREFYTGSGKLPYDKEVFFKREPKDNMVPSQRGQLTLKFDPNIRDGAWRYVTVYHFGLFEDYTGTKQWRWQNMGGTINTRNNTITVPFDSFGYYQVMYMVSSFNDVTNHPWARDDLETMYSKGYMLNKTGTSFMPNDPISRGEFATLLVKLFDIPLNYEGQRTFIDTMNPLNGGIYDYKYIETAARAGIVRGVSSGNMGTAFLPDMSITREDAAVMIARAADLKLSTSDSKTLQNLQKLFTDADSINIYARTAVEAVTKAGIIEGRENILLEGQKQATLRFDPKANFTRAEAAAVAMRILQQQKKIPK